MVSDKPNVTVGIVDCSLYTRRFALKDDSHEGRMGMSSRRVRRSGEGGLPSM